jgi:hypothetical protein
MFHISKGSVTRRKIMRHEADGFTSSPKKGVQRIFISFKSYRPRPDLISRILNPVASTITISPPRTTVNMVNALLQILSERLDYTSIYHNRCVILIGV